MSAWKSKPAKLADLAPLLKTHAEKASQERMSANTLLSGSVAASCPNNVRRSVRRRSTRAGNEGQEGLLYRSWRDDVKIWVARFEKDTKTL